MSRRRLGYWAVGALVLLVVMSWATRRPPSTPAMVSASPADGSVLASGPSVVELSFSDLVDPRRSHVLVRDDTGVSVNTTAVAAVETERISQPVTVVAPAVVTVTYHITFIDGAEIDGTYSFTVGPAGGAAAPPAAADHGHGVDPFSAALLVVDGLVVLVVAVLLVRRPRRPRPTVGPRKQNP